MDDFLTTNSHQVRYNYPDPQGQNPILRGPEHCNYSLYILRFFALMDISVPNRSYLKLCVVYQRRSVSRDSSTGM